MSLYEQSFSSARKTPDPLLYRTNFIRINAFSTTGLLSNFPVPYRSLRFYVVLVCDFDFVIWVTTYLYSIIMFDYLL